MLSFFSLLAASFSVNIRSQDGLPDPAPFTDVGFLFSTVLQALFTIAGLGALAYLVLGGIKYITSSGDKVNTQAARDQITHAVLGLAIVAASVAITGILQAVLGIRLLGKIRWPGP